MAKLFANRALDYTQLDISGLTQADFSGFEDNQNAVVHGVTYQDVVWFQSGAEVTNFGGSNITLNGEVVTGGTVTGVMTELWNGSTWVPNWQLEGLSVSAVSIYNAAMTTGTNDDFALVAAALSGADTFQLSTGNDRMRGYGGNDRLYGNRGNDVLSGDGGNDILVGGAGSDSLTGNAGADIFDFNLAGESALRTRDVVTDFARGVDKIDLSGIDANTAAGGNQAFTGFIRAGGTFSRAGQLKFVDGVLYGNTDADAGAEFAISLTGVGALTVADLVL